MMKVYPVKKNTVKWFGILFAAVTVIVALNLSDAVEVRTETVNKGNMKELVELQGRVELLHTEKVYSKLEGFVDEIYAAEGSEVAAGKKLLQLSVEDLEYSISRAEAAYNAALSQLESLKTSIKPEHVQLAEAQLVQAKAAQTAAIQEYNNKKDLFEKTKALYDSGAISEMEFREAETVFAGAESIKKSAEQAAVIAQINLELLKDGVSKSELEVMKANVEAARITVDELVNNKGKTGICSSIAGVVLTGDLEKGQAVLPGDLIYEIGDYNSAYIRVDVLADDSYKIKIGQKAVITGDVLDSKELEGEVYFIAPKAESRISSLGVEQQRIEVRIKFNNNSLKLKPGYTLDVEIATREKQDAIYISDKSVFELNGIDNVFVIKKNKLELRIVETGLENDDFTEVISGLSKGEIVVVDPESELKPGQRVKQKNKS